LKHLTPTDAPIIEVRQKATHALTQAAIVVMKVHEVGELEQRVTALEQSLAARRLNASARNMASRRMKSWRRRSNSCSSTSQSWNGNSSS
jgi:hypothetical protein